MNRGMRTDKTEKLLSLTRAYLATKRLAKS